jgi:hypothetical protein
MRNEQRLAASGLMAIFLRIRAFPDPGFPERDSALGRPKWRPVPFQRIDQSGVARGRAPRPSAPRSTPSAILGLVQRGLERPKIHLTDA